MLLTRLVFALYSFALVANAATIYTLDDGSAENALRITPNNSTMVWRALCFDRR